MTPTRDQGSPQRRPPSRAAAIFLSLVLPVAGPVYVRAWWLAIVSVALHGAALFVLFGLPMVAGYSYDFLWAQHSGDAGLGLMVLEILLGFPLVISARLADLIGTAIFAALRHSTAAVQRKRQ